jgi:hypothetical protein
MKHHTNTHPKTTYKARISGHRELIDPSTGEVVWATTVEQEVEKDCNFHRIWLSRLLLNLDRIGNQKLRLASWILDNINYETNELQASQREMAKATKMCIQTVSRTIKLLMSDDIPFLKLKSKQKSIYMINPDILFNGSAAKRQAILFEFKEVGKTRSLFPDVVKDKVG